MRRLVSLLSTAVLVASAALVPGTAAAGERHHTGRYPSVIALPDGFQPEGISAGRGKTFYVGSLANGAIYRGSVKTGKGDILVPGTPGSVAVGTEVDRRDRLFVAGGPTGAARVYDAGSGALLADYQLTAPGTGFVNDVVVTRRAAYFTDSVNPRLYVVPLGRKGHLGEPRMLPLTGDIAYEEGFNANGIEASPNGRTLLVVQSNTGLLFAVDARSGVATEVDLGGASLTSGDGLLRHGRTLYVVRNQLNEIAVLGLRGCYDSARLVKTLTSPRFDVPTTVARFRSGLYAVNARFGTTPTPDTEYTVVRVRRR